MKEIILNKILSGRFIFTLVVAIVFATLSLRGILPTDKVMEVTLLVMYAYFNRQRRTEGGEGNGTTHTPSP